MIRFHWKHIAIALAIFPVAAILVTWIGFFNVGASSGHWKITDWFLHFAMRSAIRTYALAIEPPDELPRFAIQPAAAHFARGCATCHGAPGESRSATALNMLPRPPDLLDVVDEWTDAQLFRIVKHGVRFTGMPAWPTQDRDDEVWAMVAFLRQLPKLDAKAYRRLAYGGEAPPLHAVGFEAALGECARCHGTDGLERSPATPILAGQNEAYMAAALRAYAERKRASGIMMLASTAVDEADWQALARHFAGMERKPGPPDSANAQVIEAGEAVAAQGKPTAGVPACLGCHERPDGNPLYPVLSGQGQTYLETQLRLFRHGKRGGSQFSHLMTNAAKGLTDADIGALSAYFANRRQD